jgi:hypothetical protein
MNRKKRRYMFEAVGGAVLLSVVAAGWLLWNAISYKPSVMDGYESVDALQQTVTFGSSTGTVAAAGAIWLAGIVLAAFIYYRIRSKLGSKSKD